MGVDEPGPLFGREKHAGESREVGINYCGKVLSCTFGGVVGEKINAKIFVVLPRFTAREESGEGVAGALVGEVERGMRGFAPGLYLRFLNVDHQAVWFGLSDHKLENLREIGGGGGVDGQIIGEGVEGGARVGEDIRDFVEEGVDI